MLTCVCLCVCVCCLVCLWNKGKEKDGLRIGIDLTNGGGDNDGAIDGKRYFQTKENRGKFVCPDEILMAYRGSK